MNRIFAYLTGVVITASCVAQEEQTAQPVYNIFNTTRMVNGHTTETLWRHELDVRITHHFGNMATSGAARSLFGIDEAADIRIAFEYGLYNDILIGFGRSKGAGPVTEVWDGFAKWRILQQNSDWSTPMSLVLLGTASYTSMAANPDLSSPAAYTNTSQRFSYSTQLLASAKFGERLSVQLMPTFVWRNFVAYQDNNELFALGGAVAYRVTKVMSILVEYYQNFPDIRSIRDVNYRSPLGFGLEWNTGGHVFHVTFTNSRPIGETQFIPYTASRWDKGEFRIGFTISRIFKL